MPSLESMIGLTESEPSGNRAAVAVAGVAYWMSREEPLPEPTVLQPAAAATGAIPIEPNTEEVVEPAAPAPPPPASAPLVDGGL